jgi:hypothetical protein
MVFSKILLLDYQQQIGNNQVLFFTSSPKEADGLDSFYVQKNKNEERLEGRQQYRWRE